MKLYLEAIGINDYKGNSMDLAGCVNDAEDIIAALGPKCEQVVKLLDSQATKVNIIGQTRHLMAKLKSDDMLIVTISSHGTWVPDLSGDEPDGRDEAIVPYDYPNLLLDDEVNDLLALRPAGSNVFVLSDACNSGTITRFAPNSFPSPFGDDSEDDRDFYPLPRFMPPSMLDTVDLAEAVMISRRLRAIKVREFPGLIHLAGCLDHEFCYDASFNGRPNGAMTYAFLRSLERMQRGSNFATLFSRIRSMLPNQRYPQTPKLNARTKVEARWDIPWLL